MTQSYLNPAHILSDLDIAHDSMHVADFGCGSGYFTMAVAHSVGGDGMVTAIDVRDTALQSVKSQADIRGYNNIKAIRGNLELPSGSGLAHNSQDLVLLINLLFMSQNKDKIFQEAYRVTKPGGHMLLIDWKPGTTLAPKQGYLTNSEEVKNIAEQSSFRLIKPITTDPFHYGMLFGK